MNQTNARIDPQNTEMRRWSQKALSLLTLSPFQLFLAFSYAETTATLGTSSPHLPHCNKSEIPQLVNGYSPLQGLATDGVSHRIYSLCTNGNPRASIHHKYPPAGLVFVECFALNQGRSFSRKKLFRIFVQMKLVVGGAVLMSSTTIKS